MMEAERTSLARGELAPIVERGLEQYVGADDVGRDEGARPVDRAVDMALSREMHDDVGPEELKCVGHRAGVADVGLEEAVARTSRDGLQRLEVPRIGQFVDDEHIAAACDEVADDGRADEARAARYQEALRHRRTRDSGTAT